MNNLGLALLGFTVSVGDKVLVKDLSIELAPQEKCLVLGLNGAGKSSLLRVIAGQAAPHLRLTGERRANATSMQPAVQPALRAQDINFLPQKLQWATQLSPADVAALLQLPDAAWARAQQAFGLPDSWRNQALAVRSQGQQQRIAIALLSARTAKLTIYDEPLTYLDFVAQAQLLQCLRCTPDTGPILLSSHHIDEALPWADSVLMLLGGGRWRYAHRADTTAEQIKAELQS